MTTLIRMLLAAAAGLAAPATLAAQCTPDVLVAYYSLTGHTRQLADAVAAGAREAGGRVHLQPVDSVALDVLLAADAVIVGSPVTNATMAPAVQQFLMRWPHASGAMRDKLGAAFVAGGGLSAGEETAQLAILQAMLVHGMVVLGGADWMSAFGASAVTEEEPFDSPGAVAAQFLAKARGLGERVARVAARLRCGG